MPIATRFSPLLVLAVLATVLSGYHVQAEALGEGSAIRLAQADAARQEAAAIIRAAEEEAARIRGEALKRAAEIEAEATRNAAQIEADAIRKAASQAPAAPSDTAPVATVEAPRERYPAIGGVWKWEGNSRNRKFKLEHLPDGQVFTKLYKSPRTERYREDLRYENGVLTGKTFQVFETNTGAEVKRFRTFELEISLDGGSLAGFIREWEEPGRKDKDMEVVWRRLGN